MKYTASNGFVIENAPILESGIHKALDEAPPNSDEYWALIEYLDWHKEKFTIKSGKSLRFD